MNSRAYLLNWLFAALSALAVIGSAFYVETTYLEQLRQKRVLETRARISEAGASIESVIRSNLASLQGLAAYLSIKPDISRTDFAETANLFLSNNDMVNTVYRISSSFQYTHRYPGAINLDLLDSFIRVDSQDFELARRAVETGEVFVSGPVTESNGIDFLHVWLPLQGNGRQHRTALLFFPISLNQLYETSGLDQVSKDMDIAVRTIRDGKPAAVFYGSPSLFSVSDITYSFSLPGAQWQIVAGIKKDSFVERSSRLWIQLAAGLLIGIIFLILWLRLKELKAVGLIENQQLMLDQAQRVGRIGNWSWNISKDDIFWSDEAYRLFGLEKGDPSLKKGGYLQFVHEQDREAVERAIDEAMSRGGRYQADFRLMRADFDQRWIHSEGFVELSSDRKPIRVFGTFQDVTSSRKIERELKQREAQLTAITDAAQSLIMITRASDGKVLFTNPSSRRMLGIDPQSLVGRSIVELYPSPEDRQQVLRRVEKDKQLSNYTLRLRRADNGEISTFLIGLQLIRFQGEDCFVVDMVDITSMLEAQLALAESEEKFRLFAENVPGIFWLSHPEGND
ncbi:PAS domain-containing protein, partial [Oceanospirillum sp. HFRX-1_2]